MPRTVEHLYSNHNSEKGFITQPPSQGEKPKLSGKEQTQPAPKYSNSCFSPEVLFLHYVYEVPRAGMGFTEKSKKNLEGSVNLQPLIQGC